MKKVVDFFSAFIVGLVGAIVVTGLLYLLVSIVKNIGGLLF